MENNESKIERIEKRALSAGNCLTFDSERIIESPKKCNIRIKATGNNGRFCKKSKTIILYF